MVLVSYLKHYWSSYKIWLTLENKFNIQVGAEKQVAWIKMEQFSVSHPQKSIIETVYWLV